MVWPGIIRVRLCCMCLCVDCGGSESLVVYFNLSSDSFEIFNFGPPDWGALGSRWIMDETSLKSSHALH